MPLNIGSTLIRRPYLPLAFWALSALQMVACIPERPDSQEGAAEGEGGAGDGGTAGAVSGGSGGVGGAVSGGSGGVGGSGGSGSDDACHAIKLLSPEARISLPNTGFGTGHGDFTLDYWAKYHGEFTGERLFHTNEDYSAWYIGCGVANDGVAFCRSYDDSGPGGSGNGNGHSDFSFPTEGWHHVAYVRASNVAYVYVDGVRVASDPIAVEIKAMSPVSIGKLAGYEVSGAAPAFVGPIRFSNVARYTEPFTPETSWRVDEVTVAQYLVDEPLGSSLVDEAGGNNTSTSLADVAISNDDSPCGGVAAWLSAHQGGFCNDAHNKRMNVCGDVAYCTDQTLLKTYTNGLAIDVGFDWPGDDSGFVLNAGGDTAGGNVLIELNSSGTIGAYGPGTTPGLEAPLTPGRHLVSYYASATAHALYIDGVLVAAVGGSGAAPTMVTTQGPGFTLGSRMSNEVPPGEAHWLKFAPFFFHLREAAPSTWSFVGATTAQPTSVVFLDTPGVSESTWASSVGSYIAAGQDGLTWVPTVRDGCF